MGIRVYDEKALKYAEAVANGQGLDLGPRGFYGFTCQEMFYDDRSFLVNGSILTSSTRREYFGRKTVSAVGLPRIRVDESLPKRIVSIMAEKPASEKPNFQAQIATRLALNISIKG